MKLDRTKKMEKLDWQRSKEQDIVTVKFHQNNKNENPVGTVLENGVQVYPVSSSPPVSSNVSPTVLASSSSLNNFIQSVDLFVSNKGISCRDIKGKTKEV